MLVFCHGLESGPHGRKYQALADAGLNPTAPDFRDMALAERVAKLVPILRVADTPVVVGSSYGGITALCAAMQVAAEGITLGGLLLCAPALARDEPPANAMTLAPPTTTVIIHGIHDDVVPVDVSRAFAKAHPVVDLIEVDDGHRLAASIDLIVSEVRSLLAR